MSHDGRDLFAPKLGLTLPLCGLHFIFFFLVVADPSRTLAIFGFEPWKVVSAPWTVITYQFLHSGPMSLFFGAMGLYILGSALEAEWGTREFTVFWLVATLGGSFSAWLLGSPLYTDPFIVPVSMLFAYAFLFPDMQFLMFFVIPMKVKWLALLAAAFLLFDFVVDLKTRGAAPAAVRLIGASAGFLYFWARERGRTHARVLTKQAIHAVKSAGAVRVDEALEKRNRELFPNVERLRQETRTSPGPSPEMNQFSADLAKLVVPGVNICKPVDFKGDKDPICLKCEGFAECSLRYVAGKPDEIIVKKREE
jgi:membrane associated rhomboid family serine protease